VDLEISDAGSEDSDSPKLLHESIAGLKQKSSKRTPQPPPEDDNRDARTVFVGNLSVDVVKKRVRLSLVLFFAAAAYSTHVAIAETASPTCPFPLP